MIRYVVKHLPTGHYMPEPTGRRGRGGSHVNPDPDSNKARLFMSERSAKIYVTTYCMGKVTQTAGYSPGHPGNDWEADYWDERHIEPQPDRKREDYEIIKLEIVMP